MSWATRKRFSISALIALVAVLIVSVPVYLNVNTPPTCSDGKQNGDEAGVDCGGTCALICRVDAPIPRVEFVRPIQTSKGKTDVIAYIDNTRSAFGSKVPYKLTLYDDANRELVKKRGTLTLPPGRTPLYVPNVFNSDERVARAFVELESQEGVWVTYSEPLPSFVVESASHKNASTSPRLDVKIHNPHTELFTDVLVIAVVYDAEENVVGASQTILTRILPDADALLTFTWPEAFVRPVVREEIVPVFFHE